MSRLTAAAVRIFVDDLPAAVAFYGDALGLPLAASGPGYAVFGAGPIELVIEPGGADDHSRLLVGRFTGLSLRSDDVQRDYDRLRALVACRHGSPQRQDWGGILVSVVDPAGNELQIVQYPAGG